MEVESRENPRTRRVRQLILETAVEILLESGAQEVTASTVAERADVARTTIYRHWPDQQSLLLATIAALTTPSATSTPTGSLADDLPRELERLRTRLVKRNVRSVFGALAGYASQHNEFQDAQRLFVEQLTQPIVVVLEAAQQRGKLPADLDCAFEATLLVSPILHQHLALCSKITDTLIDEVSQRWLAAN